MLLFILPRLVLAGAYSGSIVRFPRSFSRFSSTKGPHTLARGLGLRGGAGEGPLDGSTAFVTGSTDGIGQHTAKKLACEGCSVIMHGRDKKRLEKAIELVKKASNNDKITGYIADFESIQEIHKLGKQVAKDNPKIDILINNAGVFNPKNIKTQDGYDTTWQVNVIAPFILTQSLLPCIRNSENGRIIIVSSISQSSSLDFENLSHEKGYSPHNAYSVSKLGDAMLAYELSDRLQKNGEKITVNTLDPGTVNTKMLLDGWGPCGIEVSQANDQFWLATSPTVKGVSGKYFVYRNERSSSRYAYDVSNREKLWRHLEKAASLNVA